MIRTTTVCDICKYELKGEDKPYIIQVDKKVHDLCSECHGKVKKLFADSGRDILEAPGWVPPLNLNNPNSILGPGYLGNQTIGIAPYQYGGNVQNSDMASMPGGLQYTLTNNSGVLESLGQTSLWIATEIDPA